MEYNVRSVTELKSIKETLEDRYSSNQLIHVLDILCYNAMWPILEHTNYVDMMIASLLPWYLRNGRRKINSMTKEKTRYLIYRFLSTKDREKKLRILRRLKLERNILFSIVSSFLYVTKECDALDLETIKNKDPMGLVRASVYKDRMEAALDCDHSLVPIRKRAYYWYKMTMKFRNQILEKYLRHVVVQANLHYRMHSERLDFHDVLHNFVLAVNKGINKYDPDKGTLTSYINNWIRNAKTGTQKYSQEYGIAYSMPTTKKRGKNGWNNVFVPMDDRRVEGMASSIPTPEEECSKEASIQRVRRVAKAMDKGGLGRLSLGVEEELSSEEISLLRTACVAS